jgi:two-component system LytT family response regulator
MRAIIVDDEQNNVDNLLILLEKHCPQVAVVATANNAVDGKKLIQELHPDILFLDIQMPGQNGFGLLSSLSSYSFEVIFVTGFDQYSIQAIRFSALDYLLKPIDHLELESAVKRAELKFLQKSQNLQLENLMKLLHQGQQRIEHRIALPSAKETRFIKTSQIIRCEAENNYTVFFLAGGEKLVVSKPMFEYDELLADYGFIRCHNSHLVNKAYVKSWIREDSGYLLLEDGIQVPISRQKREQIKLALK